MTIEEAAVGDVSKEVAAYALYADMVEREEAAAEGGFLSSIKNAISGSTGGQDTHPDLASISNVSGMEQTASFRSRVPSFKQFVELQHNFQVLPATGTRSESAEQTPSDSVAADPSSADFRDRIGSMRERVGSRRASYVDYAESSNIFTSSNTAPSIPVVTLEQIGKRISDQNDSSVLGPIFEHEESPASDATNPVAAPSAKTADLQAKHGLRRWVDAGNIRIYLLICTFYPIAQIIRIFSDIYVRFWTEKTYFSSQQANLEVYSYLVEG
jgi:hypothetical protein